LSTNYFNTFGVTNAGSDGPSLIFWTFKCNNANNTQTAFCSNHEIAKCRGKSWIVQLSALANSIATTTAEYESLHWPISNNLGKLAVVPKSKSFILNLPQPNVNIKDSLGVCLAISVN